MLSFTESGIDEHTGANHTAESITCPFLRLAETLLVFSAAALSFQGQNSQMKLTRRYVN